jgi:hypothetical protein
MKPHCYHEGPVLQYVLCGQGFVSCHHQVWGLPIFYARNRVNATFCVGTLIRTPRVTTVVAWPTRTWNEVFCIGKQTVFCFQCHRPSTLHPNYFLIIITRRGRFLFREEEYGFSSLLPLKYPWRSENIFVKKEIVIRGKLFGQRPFQNYW